LLSNKDSRFNSLSGINTISKASLDIGQGGVRRVNKANGEEVFIAKYASTGSAPDFTTITKYVKKNLPSGAQFENTFFPDSWSTKETIEQIASARGRTAVPWTQGTGWQQGLEAVSESGVIIRWFNLPAPTTYFPKFVP